MPVITPDTKSYRVDSNLDPRRPAASFEADLASANRFLSRTLDDRQTIRGSLLDAGGSPESATIIDQGIIRQYDVPILPSSTTMTVHGFDQAKLLRMRHVWILFKRTFSLLPNPSPVISQRDPLRGAPTIMAGVWTAQSIAVACCAAKGLGLLWQAPNYEFITDFMAQGTLSEVIQQLLAPYSEVPDPFKIDIIFVGGDVIVRQRTHFASPGPDWVTTIGTEECPLKTLTLSARPTFLDGTPEFVIVRGRPGTTVTFTPGTTEKTIIADTPDVTIEATFREPDHSLLQSITRYKVPSPAADTLRITREELFNNWTDPIYDILTNTNIVAVTVTRSSANRHGVDTREPSPKERLLEQHIKIFWYGSDTFLVEEMTLVRKFQVGDASSTQGQYNAGGLKDNSLTLRTCYITGRAEWVDTVISYTAGPSGQCITVSNGVAFLSSDIIEKSRSAQLSSGYPPSGPGRRAAGSFGAGLPLVVVRAVSTSTNDRDHVIEISNGNLSQGDAELLANFFVRAWTSYKWEIELDFTATSMPWLKRGSKILVQGVTTEDGTPIPLLPALVTELSFDHSEESGRSIMTGRASFWTP